MTGVEDFVFSADQVGFAAVLATVAIVALAILRSYELPLCSRTLWLLRHQRQHKQGPWGPGGAWGHW